MERKSDVTKDKEKFLWVIMVAFVFMFLSGEVKSEDTTNLGESAVATNADVISGVDACPLPVANAINDGGIGQTGGKSLIDPNSNKKEQKGNDG